MNLSSLFLNLKDLNDFIFLIFWVTFYSFVSSTYGKTMHELEVTKLPGYRFLISYQVTELPLNNELINMIKCDCYPNHEICRNKNTCEFWIPLNQKLKQLNQQISYELKKLKSLNQRKRDYFKILDEIQDGVYTEIVAIDGRLKKVPKKNVIGEAILKPEDVQVGLNYNSISQEITDTETIIRELRRRENNILKILKKRGNNYENE